MDVFWSSKRLDAIFQEAENIKGSPIAEIFKAGYIELSKIKSGEFEPFTGPITKQDGTEWLKAGEEADDATLLGMNFYVKGVDDKLPQ